MITQQELKQQLHYDPDTGVFTWLVSNAQCVKVVDIAGSYNSQGYRQIMINYKYYRAHRLAWLYMYGNFPIDQIDHINNKKDDNRIINLREANNSENGQNKIKAQSNNKLGLLGVSKNRTGFQARIKLNNTIKCLGTYTTPEEAHEVYLEAKRNMHEYCTI
jgi:hypothetical protein